MKLRYLLLFISYIFINQSLAQYIPGYVESSSGLDNPALDGGRTEIELADINNDGNLDIVSIGDHGCPYINTNEHGIMVWFGDGTGNWSVVENGEFGYGGIAVGDVNNDGMLDVGYGMHHNYSSTDFGDQLIEVALGDGTGLNWTPWDDGLATNGESWGMFGTDFDDIDCDGDLDLGSNSFGASAGVHIYLNNGDGTWTQSFGFVGGNSTEDFVFGDVNNDGYPDFAAAQQNGTVYINDSTGNFVQSDGNLPPAGSMGRYGPDLGDIDNDGTDELSFANFNGGVEVWKWSEGNQWTSLSVGLPSSGSFQATQLWDMNLDDFSDLVAFADGLVRIWLGDGNGNWSQAADISVPNSGTFIALRVEGDADHNGYPDIALVDEEGSFITYQNYLRFFKESSPADNLSVTAVYPSANRHINIGSVQTIKWVSEVPAGNGSIVKLEVSKNDTFGPWTLISNQLQNNGQYQWIVPDTLASLQPCRLKFTVFSGSDSAAGYSKAFFISPENAVPVELTSFTANVNMNTVTLNWQTASEINNKGFEVQKNEAAPLPGGERKGWVNIGFINGSGTTTKLNSYSFNEKNVSPGTYQYRLKQIDFDGTYNYSKEVEVKINESAEFSLEQNYPNPFNPVTIISYQLPDNNFVTLKIYNTLGEEVATLVNKQQTPGAYKVNFDGSNLPSGVYIYRLTALPVLPGGRQTGNYTAAKKLILLK